MKKKSLIWISGFDLIFTSVNVSQRGIRVILLDVL